MNLELEMGPETPAPRDEPETVLTPEIITPDEMKQLEKPEDFNAKLIRVREMASALTPHDTLSLQRVVALIEICDVAADHAEARLNAIIEEPSKIVKNAKDIWTPFRDGFRELKKAKSEEAARYVVEQKRLIAERQRQAIADAKAAKDKKEREEREQREEAERLRLAAQKAKDDEAARIKKVEADRLAAIQKEKDDAQALIDAKERGDKEAARLAQQAIDDAKAAELQKEKDDEAARVAAEAEQERLNKLATKAETKADKLELAGSLVVTDVVEDQAKTIDIGSSKLSTRAPKKTWVLPGWDKKKPIRLTDPALAKVLGDISTLPADIQFLLRYSDLNHVYLNKAFGEVTFPEAFGEGEDFGGSQLRK